MTLLGLLLTLLSLQFALFLGKLPQTWKACKITTENLMNDRSCSVTASYRLTFAIGILTSFFIIWRTLFIEKLSFFTPYTEDDLNSIRKLVKD